MKKLTLKKETLMRLTHGDSQNVVGAGTTAGSAFSACNLCPDTVNCPTTAGIDCGVTLPPPTAEPTVCVVMTGQAYCNTTKCTTYAGC